MHLPLNFKPKPSPVNNNPAQSSLCIEITQLYTFKLHAVHIQPYRTLSDNKKGRETSPSRVEVKVSGQAKQTQDLRRRLVFFHVTLQ